MEDGIINIFLLFCSLSFSGLLIRLSKWQRVDAAGQTRQP